MGFFIRLEDHFVGSDTGGNGNGNGNGNGKSQKPKAKAPYKIITVE